MAGRAARSAGARAVSARTAWCASRPASSRRSSAKACPAAHVDLFPNGFEESFFRLEPGTREKMRAELGWGKAFVAVYTGVHTEVTAIETLVRAAAVLRARRDIR